MYKKIILFFIMAIGLQCSTDEAVLDGAPGPYFDLTDWMEDVFIGRTTEVDVIKRIKINEEEEEKEIENFDLRSDLASWKKLDWNDTRLYGTYRVDTILNGAQDKTIRYQSLASSNTISQAFIHIKNEDVTTVQLISDASSVMSASRKEYLLELNKGYTMRFCDTLIWSEGNCTQMDVDFK